METNSLISTENIIEFLPNHLYWLDSEGYYLGCNQLQAKTFGLASPKEIFGKQNLDLVCFKNFPQLAEIIDQNNFTVMTSGLPLSIEEIIPDLNGILSTYLSHKVPLRDPQNNIIGLLGTSYKIDTIKFREDKLLAEKERAEFTLQNIISHLPGHVYWKDRDGRYLGCNDKQAESLNLQSPDEIIGKTDFDLSWKEKAHEIRKNDLEVIKKGHLIAVEESGKLADGSTVVAISQKAPLRNKNDEIIGLLGISFDITELKQAQKQALDAQAKASAEKATKRALLIFAGMQTHDLRTPLATIDLAISGFKKNIETLISSYQKAKEIGIETDYISPNVLNHMKNIPNDISECVRTANQYINSSLKSIKSASNGEELLTSDQLSICDAERLLRSIVQNYPCDFETREKIHLNTHHSFKFMGNEIFFNRVIENLIKNAFEQIELKSKGEIFIACHSHDEVNTIKIKDMAGGVTDELIPQLFNGIQSSKEGGTGIGLSSAKQILQAFGGDIDCHRVDGDCIEFVLSFPALG